jgi:hypothetical protein
MRAFAVCLPLLLLAPLAAQQQFSGASSSQNYFMAAVELGSGEDADSTLYRLRSSQGSGVVVEPDASSATYRMRGGFFGALSAPLTGQPWLTAVRPFFVPQTGSPNLTLHGTEMYLGSTPTVQIGGQPASTGARFVDRMVATLPDQPAPGFQPVLVSNNLGQTVLNEGVGVLPMFYLREPADGYERTELRYQGTPGDMMILALGIGQVQNGYVLPGYRYALQIDPNLILATNFFAVLDPEGTMTLQLPRFAPTNLLRVQSLVLTNNPGYAPGSWTNSQPL